MGENSSWERARKGITFFGIFSIFQIILNSNAFVLLVSASSSYNTTPLIRSIIFGVTSSFRAILTCYLFWGFIKNKILCQQNGSNIKVFFTLILTSQILSIIPGFLNYFLYDRLNISHNWEYFLTNIPPNFILLMEYVFFLLTWITINKPFQDSPLKELPGLRGSVTWNNIGYIGGIIFSSFNVLYWLSRILDIEIYLLFYAFSFLNLVIPFLFAAGYLRLGSEMKYVKFLNTESGVIVEITEPKPTVKTIEEVHPCPNCGTRIIQDEKFCFKCGKRIEGI